MKKIYWLILFFSLGVSLTFSSPRAEKIDAQKPNLEKIEFIHWQKNFAKPGTSKGKTPACFKFLSPTKVKWLNLPVSFRINPTNLQNLDLNFIVDNLVKAGETWDEVISSDLVNQIPIIDFSANYGIQDYQNAIAFGNDPREGVIAVTTIWFNPATKAIVEFDMLFDTDWFWGDANLNPSVMDLLNIATHEWGHALGLNDVYESLCSEVSMYGYSDYGETKKRTLELPDIEGLRKLYGL